MKKIIIVFCILLGLQSCGTGAYSVSSGTPDMAYLSFTADDSYMISVILDEQTYTVNTVKTKAYKTQRNIKQTSKNQIMLKPGTHEMKVYKDTTLVMSKKLFVSAAEKKIIAL